MLSHTRARMIAATAALVVVLIAPAASVAATTLPAGSVLSANLRTALDTKTAYTGQPISLAVGPPYPAQSVGLQGALIYGHVSEVQSAGQGRTPKLNLVLDNIVFTNGSKQTLSATVFEIKEQRSGASPLVKGAAGALGGMLIGNWLGKALFGTKVGGIAGATAGYLLASNNKSNFHVAAGSAAGVKLTGALRVP